MRFALTIFGTPDGFDSQSSGDEALSGRSLTSKFDSLGFSKTEIPHAVPVYGLFKKQSEVGELLGIGIFSNARENNENRPGGYLGVGVLLQDTLAPSELILTAIREFHSKVSVIALSSDRLTFSVRRFIDLPPIEPPESCFFLRESIYPIIGSSPRASVELNSICIDARQRGIQTAIDILLGNLSCIKECSLFLADVDAAVSGLSRSCARLMNEDDLSAVLVEGNRQLSTSGYEAIGRQRRRDRQTQGPVAPKTIQTAYERYELEIGREPEAPAVSERGRRASSSPIRSERVGSARDSQLQHGAEDRAQVGRVRSVTASVLDEQKQEFRDALARQNHETNSRLLVGCAVSFLVGLAVGFLASLFLGR
jgi:hypothetical protein